MPKKSASVRSGTQRNKPKVQKSFELVRSETEVSEMPDTANVATVTPALTTVSTPEKPITPKKQPAPLEPEKQDDSEATMPKGSAAARMAVRRRAAQKAQQRNAISLITAEHFAYVRRDLITIAILACIMFTAIIVLYVTIGRA
ncbi:MAG TPA: hypothetical protein VGL94_18450 [Ktedonobacteraceae bacterium]